MSRKLLWAFCSLFLLISVAVHWGQSRKPIVTNELVIELHRAKMAEADLIALIEKSICKCDTSGVGIGKMRNEGVPISVIGAMLKAETEQITEGSIPGGDDPSSFIPVNEESLLSQITEAGIYLHDFGRLKLLEPTVFSGGRVNSPILGNLTLGLVKDKLRARIRGRAANTFTKGNRPVFYFVFNPSLRKPDEVMTGLFWGLPAASPNEFVMIQMEVKGASREAILWEASTYSGLSSGVPEKSIRDFSFEKLSPGLYRVIPSDNLPVGEYSFYFAAGDFDPKSGGGKIFDFGIR